MSTSNKSNPDEIIWDISNENKSWWKKRSSLEKKLIMSLIGIVVLAIGILVYMGVKPTHGLSNDTICAAPECLVTASDLINRIDSAVYPCDDFFKFACGKFVKNTVEEDTKKELLDILKSPEINDDHYLLRNEKRLFQTCLNEADLEDESLPIIHSLIRELNEWPVIVGHKWRERQFDWSETLIKLRNTGYSDTMLIRINKLYSDDKTLKLEILPAATTKVRKEYKDAYVKYMSEIAELFGAEPNRAAIEMEKVSDFIEKLDELSQIYRKGNISKMSISEFEDEYDDVNWFKLMQAFTSPAKVIITDYGNFPSSDFMDGFTTLMSKTPKRIQANYMIWSVIENLIPFMPKAFRAAEANYTCATNIKFTENDRESLCQSIVENLFIPVPSWIIYIRNHLTKEKQKQAEVVFNTIKEELMNLLENLPWVPDVEKTNFLQKLNDTSAVIGTQWDYEDDSIFEKYEPNTNKRVYRGSFLIMYLNRKKQKKNFPINAADSRLNTNISWTLPVYDMQNTKLEIPVGVFQKQFYKPEAPMYLTYSGLGKAIAQELLRTLTFGASNRTWFKNTLANYADQAKCFLKSDDVPLDSADVQVYAQEGILANLVALKVAYKVYQNFVEENGEEAIPLGIEYTPNQLFWVASTSYECYESIHDSVQSYTQKEYQKNIPFMNSEEFINDFGCPADSKMNKAEKCKIEE